MTRYRRGGPAAALALAAASVAGCGGGSGGGEPAARSTGGTPAPVAQAPGTEPLPVDPATDAPVRDAASATVVLARRDTVMTADAWFSPDAAGPHPATGRGCEVRREGLPAAGAGDGPAGAGVPETVAWADAIVLSSREGEFGTLVAHRLGATTVYATERRWLRPPYPEDLTLEMRAGDVAVGFAPVPVTVPEIPELLAPADHLVADPAAPIRWSVPEGAGGTAVRLLVTGWDEAGAATVHAVCTVEDVGEFALPETVRAALDPALARTSVEIERLWHARASADGRTLDVVASVRP